LPLQLTKIIRSIPDQSCHNPVLVLASLLTIAIIRESMSDRVFEELFHPVLLVVSQRRLLPGELFGLFTFKLWLFQVGH